MADLLEKLWPAFVSEVTEQLDNVELLLAKSGAAGSIDVNQLFRNFHTIKGNCSMIGFTSMETIAHRSEDILSEVRNGALEMTDDVIDILLASISRLKKQFQYANDSRENPPQDDELVERLTGFVEEKLGSGSNGGETVADNAVSDEQFQEQLQALSGSAKVAVPSLVLGLDVAAKPQQVEAAVSVMSAHAGSIGFKALKNSLNHFIEVLHGDGDDKPGLLLALAAEIFDDIGFICEKHDVDLGLELGARLCKGKLAGKYYEELDALAAVLDQLKTTNESEWQVEQFLSLITLATTLGHYATLFRLQELNASWRYIRQLVIEVSRGYLVFNIDIIEKIIGIVELGRSLEEDDAACTDALDSLQTTTAKHNHESDEINQAKEAIVANSTLCIDSLCDLKMDVLSVIQKAIDDGLMPLEIDIDFSDEETSEKVLTTVRNLGELVHSRTMFHDIVNGVAQRTSFSFLILSSKPLDDVIQVLRIVDRGKNTFTILGLDDEKNSDNQVETDTQTAPQPPAATNESSTTDQPDADEVDDAEEATQALLADTAMSMGSLKVEGGAIDQVISDVGELITHHNRMSHLIMQDDLMINLSHMKGALEKHPDPLLQQVYSFFEGLHHQLTATNENLQTSLNSLQNSVLGLRVVPISYAFNRFHTFVRTIGQKLGKKVLLEVEGEQVKVDKGMIDVLSEPLAHMVRNSIDHGIESLEQRKAAGKDEYGTVKLKAVQQSGMVIIEISDDGAGLDRDRILEKCISKGMLNADEEYSDQQIFANIFEPGFSTSEVLTETSGRGVGMDVVKSKIVQVGGAVAVESEKGKGTTIQLKLPVSAAIQSVVLVNNAGQTLAFPERYVVEVLNISRDDVQIIQGQSVIIWREGIVPLYRLDKLVHSSDEEAGDQPDHLEVVIIANDQHTAALVVDAAVGRAEVLVRDVHESLKYMVAVSAAAILGDGSVVIILDCEGLFQLALNHAQNILNLTA